MKSTRAKALMALVVLTLGCNAFKSFIIRSYIGLFKGDGIILVWPPADTTHVDPTDSLRMTWGSVFDSVKTLAVGQMDSVLDVACTPVGREVRIIFERQSESVIMILDSTSNVGVDVSSYCNYGKSGQLAAMLRMAVSVGDDSMIVTAISGADTLSRVVRSTVR